jgi:hypothetical protein
MDELYQPNLKIQGAELVSLELVDVEPLIQTHRLSCCTFTYVLRNLLLCGQLASLLSNGQLDLNKTYSS